MYGLLVEEGNAQREVIGCFGVFEVRDGEFSVVNYVVNLCPAYHVHESLTGMNKRRLLSQSSPKFQTTQRPRTVLADIDIRISQFE